MLLSKGILSDSQRLLRQLASELLAMAVLDQFPTALLLGGGPTRSGFGYHFVFDQPLPKEALTQIEERMRAIVDARHPIQAREMMRENAAEMLNHCGQPLRAERVLALAEQVVDVVEVGPFWDVATGPFPPHTGEFGAFRLMVAESEPDAGVFIGGIVFDTEQELKQHLRIQSAAKKRDHRLLGRELALFMPIKEAGAGQWCWTPAGQTIRDALHKWWWEQAAQLGCQAVTTPMTYRKEFSDDLGKRADDGLVLGHALWFRHTMHSHRSLPIGIAEWSRQSCDVVTGDPGLRSAAEQTFDRMTFFCLRRDVVASVASSLQFILQALKMLGVEHRVHLLTGGWGAQVTRQEWTEGERILAQAAKHQGLTVQCVAASRGVIGPTLWVNIVDSLGREFMGPEVRIESSLARRLDLKVQQADSRMEVPAIVSASVFGSLERHIAFLIEHFGGDLPVWLMPEQVRILPVTEENRSAANDLKSALSAEGVRVGIDARKETLGGRVRQAQMARVPYTVVIGDREQEEDRIAIRHSMDREVRRLRSADWIVQLKQEIRTKDLGGRTAR